LDLRAETDILGEFKKIVKLLKILLDFLTKLL